MKRLLYRDSLLATIFVFALYLGLKLVFLNLHFLEPGHEDKEDFEITDLVYSKFDEKNANGVSFGERDTCYVMVNIGNLNRSEIAELLDVIDSYNPKVIALDVLFSANKDDGDTTLATVLKKISGKLVMGGMFTYDRNTEQINGIATSQDQFNVGAKIGYTNFVTNSIQSVVRRFAPFTNTGKEEVPAFPVAIAEKYNPASIEKLKARGNETELINYKYPQENIYVFDYKDIHREDGALANLKGKIVLVGYLGSDLGHIATEDYHYTPMNEGKNKKTDPDMSGLAIHANIISMILNADYISHVPKWILWIVSFILCFVHMIFFIQYFVKKHLWFHLYFKIIQFVTSAIVIGISVMMYGKFDLRIETAILLAPIILSVDALYFFEPLMIRLHKKRGMKTYFMKMHEH